MDKIFVELPDIDELLGVKERLRAGGEAWVPVIVCDPPVSSELRQFAGKRGWIKYSNSD